jgi:hypothetical protein
MWADAPAPTAAEMTEPAYTADLAEAAEPAYAAAASGPAADAAACRVRAAGGPLDSASYTCGCGCVFAAAVTTTVACPHCGDAQAW